MASQATPTGPDLEQGVDAADVREATPLLGHVGDEAVVLVRDGGQVHALAATCTHYGGPLAEGLVTGGRIHCPWHHACFDLSTGRAHGPAIASVACFDLRLEGGKLGRPGQRDAKRGPAARPSA